MLWPRFDRMWWSLDPWSELRRLQRDLDRLDRFFEPGHARQAPGFPALNVSRGKDEAVVTAELPGIDVKDLDISVRGDTLTIRGSRKPQELKDGERFHRRERGHGEFVRTLQLPHLVDADKVQASYTDGVLRLTCPWAESEKPKQISVKN